MKDCWLLHKRRDSFLQMLERFAPEEIAGHLLDPNGQRTLALDDRRTTRLPSPCLL
jgi:hypothetical protein